jgi:hypothetical protein
VSFLELENTDLFSQSQPNTGTVLCLSGLEESSQLEVLGLKDRGSLIQQTAPIEFTFADLATRQSGGSDQTYSQAECWYPIDERGHAVEKTPRSLKVARTTRLVSLEGFWRHVWTVWRAKEGLLWI